MQPDLPDAFTVDCEGLGDFAELIMQSADLESADPAEVFDACLEVLGALIAGAEGADAQTADALRRYAVQALERHPSLMVM